MDNRSRLEEIKAELARQDAAIASAMRRLDRLGNIQIILPAEMLQELQGLEEAVKQHTAYANSPTTPTFGLRA
ncbi:MAG: hypothetical protein FWD73_05625 [Polyangiaceae bacterium]|nr:hypothetical protein [Polyangiaceae bacterium]